jgi:hypothetical protein
LKQQKNLLSGGKFYLNLKKFRATTNFITFPSTTPDEQKEIEWKAATLSSIGA